MKNELAKEKAKCVEVKTHCETAMLEYEAESDETMMENVQKKLEELNESRKRITRVRNGRCQEIVSREDSGQAERN